MKTLILTALLFGSWADQVPPKVGEPAPPIVAETWLNLEGQEKPSLGSLKGKVIVLEFWGTWCGPCVRSMPQIQEVQERYRRYEVVVLAISNEAVEPIRPFLEKNHYSMIVGANPGLATVEAYGVQAWPSTFLIDREGRLAWSGTPYGVEAELDRLLNLPTRPGALLDAYAAARAVEKQYPQKNALERLVRKAPSEFDLKAWLIGREPLARANDLQATEGTLDEAIDRYARGDASAASAILRDEAARFDLAKWARRVLARNFPIRSIDFGLLANHPPYTDVIDGLADRSPDLEAFATARLYPGLVDYCRDHAEEHRVLARKGLIALDYVFGDRPNNALAFNELAINGLQYAGPLENLPNGQINTKNAQLVGLSFNGTMLMKDEVPTFVDSHLYRYFAMKIVAGDDFRHIAMKIVAGDNPSAPERIGPWVEAEKKAIIEANRAQFGPPSERIVK